VELEVIRHGRVGSHPQCVVQWQRVAWWLLTVLGGCAAATAAISVVVVVTAVAVAGAAPAVIGAPLAWAIRLVLVAVEVRGSTAAWRVLTIA
jgi:hypothetical protein